MKQYSIISEKLHNSYQSIFFKVESSENIFGHPKFVHSYQLCSSGFVFSQGKFYKRYFENVGIFYK